MEEEEKVRKIAETLTSTAKLLRDAIGSIGRSAVESSHQIQRTANILVRDFDTWRKLTLAAEDAQRTLLGEVDSAIDTVTRAAQILLGTMLELAGLETLPRTERTGNHECAATPGCIAVARGKALYAFEWSNGEITYHKLDA